MRSASLLLLLTSCLSCVQTFAAPSVTDDQEQTIVRSLAPFAKRDGKALSLKLNNGKALQLNDGTSCDVPETCLVQRLLGLSPNRKSFVVESLGYESRTLFWIGRNSGKRYEVYSEPDVSPDGKWIITANPSEFGSTNGVFIWEVRGDRLVEKLHFEPKSYALYSFVRWEGANKVVLKKITHAYKPVCQDGQFMEFMVIVAREHSQWKFDETTGLNDVTCM